METKQKNLKEKNRNIMTDEGFWAAVLDGVLTLQRRLPSPTRNFPPLPSPTGLFFGCSKPSCVVSQQLILGIFLFHKLSNFTPSSPTSEGQCRQVSVATSSWGLCEAGVGRYGCTISFLLRRGGGGIWKIYETKKPIINSVGLQPTRVKNLLPPSELIGVSPPSRCHYSLRWWGLKHQQVMGSPSNVVFKTRRLKKLK